MPMKPDVSDIKWLNEPKRWEIINRIPKIDYKNPFHLSVKYP